MTQSAHGRHDGGAPQPSLATLRSNDGGALHDAVDFMCWDFQPAFFGVKLTRVIGIVLIIVGAPGLLDSFARFALQGLGTPPPLAPTRYLVVTGLYRFVRNPMYVAVVAVVLGQAALFSDWRLLCYGALCWLACRIFVLGYEEPTLRRAYGAEYDTYQANVPRWIPRLTPWHRV